MFLCFPFMSIKGSCTIFVRFGVCRSKVKVLFFYSKLWSAEITTNGAVDKECFFTVYADLQKEMEKWGIDPDKSCLSNHDGDILVLACDYYYCTALACRKDILCACFCFSFMFRRILRMFGRFGVCKSEVKNQDSFFLQRIVKAKQKKQNGDKTWSFYWNDVIVSWCWYCIGEI